MLSGPERAATSKREVYKALGGKCVRCGFSDMRALQLDHVAGDGATQLKKIRDRRRYYEHVLRNLAAYQILCANCNWIKKAENNEGCGVYSA